jgi:hypothetical protein
MRLLNPTQAIHFCEALLTPPAPGQVQSLKNFHDGLGKTQRLDEGTASYEIHRVNILTAVERWLLFGVAHYRRALDMCIPSAAPWMHVTLYYSAFFAANALLGMFGGWVGHKVVVDVDDPTPHTQKLRIQRKISPGPTGSTGSHQRFWDYFYQGGLTIRPWAPGPLQAALDPVSGSREWLIEARNAVNYDTIETHAVALRFHKTFNSAKLASLTGPLRQQCDTTELMLKLAFHFAGKFKIHTFGIADLGVAGTRGRIIRTVVSKKVPAMVQQSQLEALFE